MAAKYLLFKWTIIYLTNWTLNDELLIVSSFSLSQTVTVRVFLYTSSLHTLAKRVSLEGLRLTLCTNLSILQYCTFSPFIRTFSCVLVKICSSYKCLIPPTFTEHLLCEPPPPDTVFSAGETKMNLSQLLPSSSLWWAREIADQIITTYYNNYCDEQKHKVLRKHRGGETPTKTQGIKEDFLE